MHRSPTLDAQDHHRISEAVAAAEAGTSGEIVTILAERSSSYEDVALAWAALAAFTALTVIAIFPQFYLDRLAWLVGSWNHEWNAPAAFAVAAFVGAIKFASVWLIQLWLPIKFLMVPAPVKSARVRRRAITCYRVGADRRTHGRTGILIYLSMREHRAEIVADEAITAKIDADVWGEAMEAMLAELKDGRIADGMIAAIGRVGTILAEHLPRSSNDVNELPDRLIEV